jgi:hypothetical protein
MKTLIILTFSNSMNRSSSAYKAYTNCFKCCIDELLISRACLAI